MERRSFIFSGLATATLGTPALAYSPLTYAPTDWRALRETQATIVLNFRASWSLTCQIKADILKELLAEDASYRDLTFVEVDWDTFGPSEWTKRLNVKRRSTLVALRGSQEIARVENEPYVRNIQRFLDKAISA